MQARIVMGSMAKSWTVKEWVAVELPTIMDLGFITQILQDS